MKGKRYGHCSMITTINCKQTNKPHCNPHRILPLLSNLTQKFSLVVINIRTGGEQNEYGICEGFIISENEIMRGGGGGNVYCS
jgi:hypothetical protein